MDHTINPILALSLAAVLVVVAGLLVAVETAITGVSRTRALEFVKSGRGGAASLLDVVEEPARYVNVLLFLRYASSTSAIVLVALVCADQFVNDWLAFLIAAVVMLLIGYIVLGVAPRTLGAQYSEAIALRTARVTLLLASVLAPLASLLILVGNAITPGKGFREGPFASQAELRELVDQATRANVIETEEREMIHSVIELGETHVREVMVPRTEMIWIQRHRTLRQLISLCLRSGFSRVPVIGESVDDILGVVYLKDVTKRVFEHADAGQTEKVESIMREPYFVPESKRCDELLRELQAKRVHLAIAVDEYGGTAGLVTIEDVMEEIVGEIADEYDTLEIPDVQEVADGWRLSARLDVDEVADLVGDDSLREENVETVLGLMAKRLGLVPIPGATIDVNGYTLVAETSAGRRNRIATVHVIRPGGPGTPSDPASKRIANLPEPGYNGQPVEDAAGARQNVPDTSPNEE